MLTVTLRQQSTDQGTFGILYTLGFKCYTLELPWRDNKSNLSCIPKGTYAVHWTYSPHFKRYMYQITGVTGRAGIRIHSANYAGDVTKGYRSHLYGCIALGKRIGILDGQKAILVSRPTVRAFETLMNKQSFNLRIL